METKVCNINFTSSDSNVILRGRFILPPLSPSRNIPLVIMLTGDGPKGTKSLSWVNLPPRLCSFGIGSFLFDFEGLGYSDGERANLTLSKGIANFQAAFSVACSQEWVDLDRIGIFASSFGASVALIQPNIVNQVKMLGLKSPACFLAEAYANECGPHGLDEWIKDGFSKNLGYRIEVLHDALSHNIYLEAQQIQSKVFITHGDIDEIVPVYQSKFLMSSLSCDKQLEILAGVGHSYSEEGAWEQMANLFVDWFYKIL